jgi:hypothetical protein
MDGYIYYCEVKKRHVSHPIGVYSVVADKSVNPKWYPKLNELITASDRVWKQGPKGGVKIIKSPDWLCTSNYVTTSKQWMKEFFWVKLQAIPV